MRLSGWALRAGTGPLMVSGRKTAGRLKPGGAFLPLSHFAVRFCSAFVTAREEREYVWEK